MTMDDPGSARSESPARTGTRRSQTLAGPLGFFLLLLLFLFLPSVAVSCSVPPGTQVGAGTATASVTGADVITGSDPGLETTGSLRLPSQKEGEPLTDAVAPGQDVRIAGTAAVVVMALGLGLMFIGVWRPRALLTVGIATLAAALVAVTGILFVSQLTDEAKEYAEFMVYLPDGKGVDVVGRAGEVVHLGVGFFITLFGLTVIAVTNLVLLLRRKPRSPGSSA
ncbi:hypothetical protein [Amycolatopsis sp. RTGN1]|uniref:hypothetical protein n=1 Tax=Amycolatopsis ponsaeliensis TaxID=2992142 RepID=UPI00254A051E|nr:hypothetical protein [Amycolatopsis sp. RTGN1]